VRRRTGPNKQNPDSGIETVILPCIVIFYP